nr:hypothetical protein [Tanacetum cinerariifolium]
SAEYAHLPGALGDARAPRSSRGPGRRPGSSAPAAAVLRAAFLQRERSYPSSNLGRLMLLNGPLLALIGLLLIVAANAEGYLGGLGQIMAIWGLLGLGTLLNLRLASKTKDSRAGYLLMAGLYGAVFGFFTYAFGNMAAATTAAAAATAAKAAETTAAPSEATPSAAEHAAATREVAEND